MTAAPARFDWQQAAERYRPYLYRVAAQLDRSAADEIVQETLLRARNGPPEHRPELVGAWLAAIARNVHRDRLRRAARRPSLPLSDEQAAVVPSRGHPTEAMVDLAACVNALPDPYRNVIVLGGLGLGYDEIADRLRLSQGTVKSRMHRGRAALRRMLDGTAARPVRGPAPAAAGAR